MLKVEFGKKIPLQLTLNTEEATKHIVASLINIDTGAVIQAGIILANVLDGTYANLDIVMPGVPNIKAIAFVFEADTVTPSLTTPQKFTELIQLDLGRNNIGFLLNGSIKKVDKLVGSIKESVTLIGTLRDE